MEPLEDYDSIWDAVVGPIVGGIKNNELGDCPGPDSFALLMGEEGIIGDSFALIMGEEGIIGPEGVEVGSIMEGVAENHKFGSTGESGKDLVDSVSEAMSKAVDGGGEGETAWASEKDVDVSESDLKSKTLEGSVVAEKRATNSEVDVQTEGAVVDNPTIDSEAGEHSDIAPVKADVGVQAREAVPDNPTIVSVHEDVGVQTANAGVQTEEAVPDNPTIDSQADEYAEFAPIHDLVSVQTEAAVPDNPATDIEPGEPAEIAHVQEVVVQAKDTMPDNLTVVDEHGRHGLNAPGHGGIEAQIEEPEPVHPKIVDEAGKHAEIAPGEGGHEQESVGGIVDYKVNRQVVNINSDESGKSATESTNGLNADDGNIEELIHGELRQWIPRKHLAEKISEKDKAKAGVVDEGVTERESRKKNRIPSKKHDGLRAVKMEPCIATASKKLKSIQADDGKSVKAVPNKGQPSKEVISLHHSLVGILV